MPHTCMPWCSHGEPLSTWNRGLRVGVELLSQLLLGEARTTNACMWRSDLDLLGAAAGRRWHCDARGRRIHTCTAQAELGKHCERAASMNCMMPHTCRAFTACSALSSAVRGINVPVVNERLSRFGRFKLEDNGRDRTVVLNEERELPAQAFAHTRYIDARSALT